MGRAAAKSLRLSQPTLATQLSALERGAGKRLLIRSTRGSGKMLLTEEEILNAGADHGARDSPFQDTQEACPVRDRPPDFVPFLLRPAGGPPDQVWDALLGGQNGSGRQVRAAAGNERDKHHSVCNAILRMDVLSPAGDNGRSDQAICLQRRRIPL